MTLLLYLSLLITSFTIHTHNTQLPKTSPVLHETKVLKIKRKDFEIGSLSVICGSMCSGKSEELIRQVGRFILAGFNVLAFKPAIDDRKLLNLDQDPLSYIPSRTGSWINCIPVASVSHMKKIIDELNPMVIAIDEVNFFVTEQQEFITLIQSLVAKGKKVIVSGLDLNFRAEPFSPMPELLAFADTVMKLTAICSQCGDDVFCITQRLIDGNPAHYDDPLIVVGATQYEPRCRKCHIILKS